MYLMYTLDEQGKRVYTLKVRRRSSEARKEDDDSECVVVFDVSSRRRRRRREQAWDLGFPRRPKDPFRLDIRAHHVSV